MTTEPETVNQSIRFFSLDDQPDDPIKCLLHCLPLIDFGTCEEHIIKLQHTHYSIKLFFFLFGTFGGRGREQGGAESVRALGRYGLVAVVVIYQVGLHGRSIIL